MRTNKRKKSRGFFVRRPHNIVRTRFSVFLRVFASWWYLFSDMTSIATTWLVVLGWQLLAADSPLHFESHILPLFKKMWIATGAPPDNEKPIDVRPDSDPLVSAQDRQHWAFRPPTRPDVPSVRAANLVQNPLDAFLLAKLEEKGLTFSKLANPLVLTRRAYIDLIGMPPTPETDATSVSPTSFRRV
jgi:hypothetical protein